MHIRNVAVRDIDQIYLLEQSIEGKYAANRETLTARIQMFFQGFYVAEENGKIIGYLESCLWNKLNFERFDEIKDFPKHHDPEGKILYIIFVGVNKNYRKRGIGSALVRKAQEYAEQHNLQKVQVISGEGSLVYFYKKLVFGVMRELTNYLPYSSGVLMEYDEV